MIEDQSIIMEEDNSYHQAIIGKEAERRLKMCGDHCYLTRYSERRSAYVLSVLYQKNSTKHFKISVNNSGIHEVYKIEGKDKEFGRIRELLDHYEKNRMDPAFPTIGRHITEKEYRAHENKCCCIIL